MANAVFRSDVAIMLMNTLQRVSYTQDGGELDINRYYEVGTLRGAYEDQMDLAGPGLAYETEEGEEFGSGTLEEGTVTRYRARKVGLTLAMTEEVVEDGPSEWAKAIKLSTHAERAVRKTAMIDGASLFCTGFSTAYPVADGCAMFSASHTLPGGSLYSNLMAVPLGPSYAGIVAAISDCKVMPDNEGLRAGYAIKKLLHPVEQWAEWEVVFGSSMQPTPGNYSAINVVNRNFGSIERIELKFWDNTTVNWACVTDAEDGLQWKWKRRPRTDTWVDEGREVMKNKRSARYAHGITNCRAVYGVGS